MFISRSSSLYPLYLCFNRISYTKNGAYYDGIIYPYRVISVSSVKEAVISNRRGAGSHSKEFSFFTYDYNNVDFSDLENSYVNIFYSIDVKFVSSWMGDRTYTYREKYCRLPLSQLKDVLLKCACCDLTVSLNKIEGKL